MAENKYSKKPKDKYINNNVEEPPKKSSKSDFVNFCRVSPVRDSYNPELNDFTFMQIDVDCDTYTMDYGNFYI